MITEETELHDLSLQGFNLQNISEMMAQEDVRFGISIIINDEVVKMDSFLVPCNSKANKVVSLTLSGCTCGLELTPRGLFPLLWLGDCTKITLTCRDEAFRIGMFNIKDAIQWIADKTTVMYSGT